ncbi:MULTISPECIES: cytochrome b [unclassified Synechocystis]|uniref:cytochrome b n=1 Tax=unclassified Synechocystis TaxID=2640012 RepID=UPI0003F5C469|nr:MULTISPECIES: cytochrome b [unclassified Synechocystis]
MRIHWWMAACYVVLFCTGPLMVRLERGQFLRSELYDVHKSIGVLTMALLTWRILTLLRVWWRKYTKRIPKLSPAWWGTLSLHLSLYVFMWAVPISGFLLSNSFKANNVKFLGITLPDIFPENEAMIEIGRNAHFWLAYTFLAFIVIHMLNYRKVIKANWRRWANFVRKFQQLT